MKKKIVFIICFLLGIISVKNVYAASVNKSLRTTCAGTSASVTATYYTHETTRWKISNPFNIGYSGEADMLLSQANLRHLNLVVFINVHRE